MILQNRGKYTPKPVTESGKRQSQLRPNGQGQRRGKDQHPGRTEAPAPAETDTQVRAGLFLKETKGEVMATNKKGTW